MFTATELASVTPVERAKASARSEFALTEAQARLSQMVLDTVRSGNTRRNYAKGLDEVFRFAAGRPLSRELLLEWRTAMDGLMPSTVNQAVRMPYVRFAEASRSSSASDNTDLFPTLEIYDKNGALAFRGRQIRESLAIVSRLSVLVNQITGSRSGPTLDGRIKSLGLETIILPKAFKNGRATALSIMLEECGSCAVQQASLESLEHRLAAENKINRIAITVTIK